MSLQQRGCPWFAPHTPLLDAGRTGVPTCVTVMPGLGIVGRDGQTKLPTEPQRKRSSPRSPFQALSAMLHQQHHWVPEPHTSHTAVQHTLLSPAARLRTG